MKRVVRVRMAQEKEKTCAVPSVSLKRAKETGRKGRKGTKEGWPRKLRALG